MGSSALKKDIDLGYEGPDSSVMINGDMIRIRMMIDNLIDNAIRYSPKGSSVTTRIEEVEGSVILTVEDNGPGYRLGREMQFFSGSTESLTTQVQEVGWGYPLCMRLPCHMGHASHWRIRRVIGGFQRK